MNAIKKIKSVFATGLVLLLVSCNSWLEVDPEDRIMDNTLFKDKEGFMTALNGVYSELNKTSLYGRNLTMGMIDVMAQYYNCNIDAIRLIFRNICTKSLWRITFIHCC